jgi:hypothetical protein
MSSLLAVQTLYMTESMVTEETKLVCLQVWDTNILLHLFYLRLV